MAPVVSERFVIQTKFNNKGKPTIVPILNADGHIDIAHQIGLISLTSRIIRQWSVEKPAGVDEYENPKTDVTNWVEVEAVAVVKGSKPGETITANGFCCANDRDRFVKSPEYLLAVADTRAKKRALADACNITEAMINPKGKSATRETVDIPLVDNEEDPAIPQEIRKNIPDIHPPLSKTPTHPGHSEPSEDLWTG